MLSAIVIAKNEENMIVDCLKSLRFADEIVVVDNDSHDNTAKIASKYNATVVKFSGSGYDLVRNYGAQNSSHDWLFYLDADERVTTELKKVLIEISSQDSGKFTAYEIARNNFYLGRQMKHGGWGNDSVIRLLSKKHLISWIGSLHEQPKFIGPLGKITAPINHYSHRDLYSMTEKTIQFSDYEAQNRHTAGHPPVVWWRIFRVMFTEFYLRFFKLKAYKDGHEGVIDGIFQVYNSFVIYARLWELQHDQKSVYF